MKTVVCAECGKKARVVRRSYSLESMGIPAELRNTDVIDCSHCGNVDPVIPNLDQLMRVVAMAVVCCPYKLSGQEVRFLRNYANKSAREFARLLHLDHTYLSAVENDREEIGAQTDKLVRFLAMNLVPELAKEVDKFMAQLPNIKDSVSKEEIQIDPSMLTAQCV